MADLPVAMGPEPRQLGDDAVWPEDREEPQEDGARVLPDLLPRVPQPLGDEGDYAVGVGSDGVGFSAH